MVIALVSETGRNKLFGWSSNHIISLSYVNCLEVSNANLFEILILDGVQALEQ